MNLSPAPLSRRLWVSMVLFWVWSSEEWIKNSHLFVLQKTDWIHNGDKGVVYTLRQPFLSKTLILCIFIKSFFLLFFGSSFFLFRQSQDQCPTTLQLKHAPFLINSVLWLAIRTSTSMAFGSCQAWKLNFCGVLLLSLVFLFWVVLQNILISLQFCSWKAAFLYQLLRVLGMFSAQKNRWISWGGRVSLKNTMVAWESLDLSSLVQARAILNLVMCSSLFLPRLNCKAQSWTSASAGLLF